MQYEAVLELCKMIKGRTVKTIWLWSGYTLERIEELCPEILMYIDFLVDGPYVERLSEPNLQWRGSTNQRIINIADIY